MNTIISKKEQLQHLKELLIEALKRNDKYYIKHLSKEIVALIESNNSDRWANSQCGNGIKSNI